MGKPAGYLKINLEIFFRPNVKKRIKKIVLTPFSKTHFLGRKKRILVWLEILKASIFAKFNCTKKIPVYKINVRKWKKKPIKLFKWFLLSYYCCTITKSCIVDRKIARKIPLDKKQRRAIIFFVFESIFSQKYFFFGKSKKVLLDFGFYFIKKSNHFNYSSPLFQW